MRILIATDAWRPQVNGVVSTLERMTQAASEFGARFEFLTPQGMWTAPLPTYPDIRLGARLAAADRPAHRGGGARPHPYRHRRPDRLADAALLPQAQAALHHQLPHPVSRIPQGAVWHSRMADLCGLAPFSCALGRGDGADPDDRRRPHPARLRAGAALDARRQPRPLPSARRSACSTCRGRSSSRSAGWRWRRTSRRCSASTCRARPSSSATGRRARALERRYPHAHFLGAMHGEALADVYASADVFVFPSRTDTSASC